MKSLEVARLAAVPFLPLTLLQTAYFPQPRGKSASFMGAVECSPVRQMMLVHPRLSPYWKAAIILCQLVRDWQLYCGSAARISSKARVNAGLATQTM